ncbi:hypothetical protein BJX61DRAFT_310109 [Aspergillus egyptiacus]|nr:hypothetical protein BJX61DRAFT_310109 [Aspergillus egyptiacus]
MGLMISEAFLGWAGLCFRFMYCIYIQGYLTGFAVIRDMHCFPLLILFSLEFDIVFSRSIKCLLLIFLSMRTSIYMGWAIDPIDPQELVETIPT